MKTQEQINADWQQTFGSNVGSVTMLVPPKRNVPGLRKPYQYEIPAAEFKRLVADLKVLFKMHPNWLQCDLVGTKPVKYGSRFDLFLLGHRPDFCGEPEKGISSQEWHVLTRDVKQRLEQTLGADVPLYVEPWEAEEKFEARFETYVKFTEL